MRRIPSVAVDMVDVFEREIDIALHGSDPVNRLLHATIHASDCLKASGPWCGLLDRLVELGYDEISRQLKVHGIRNVANQRITNAVLNTLSPVQEIQHLSLRYSRRVTGRGLHHVGKMSQLRVLDLVDMKNIGNRSFQHLQPLAKLRCLDLSWSDYLNDSGMSQLQTLTQLAMLNLSFCDYITSAGLKHLYGMHNLEFLGLSDCYMITRRDVTKLADKLGRKTCIFS